MLTQVLRSVHIKGTLEEALHSLVALGCQHLKSLSCWLCLVKGHDSSDDLLSDVQMLAEGLCLLRTLKAKEIKSLQCLEWRKYRSGILDDEHSAAENVQFAAALARLMALERLVLEDMNHMYRVLAVLLSLRLLVLLVTQWAEGMEAVLLQCMQLTFLHLWPHDLSDSRLQVEVWDMTISLDEYSEERG
eukprot:m51a1_g9755 hypothetical protein (189) ;mRNA; f:1608170-1608964